MDYKNGTIYKILNTVDDACYVGSTCQALSNRMAYHRKARARKVKNTKGIYSKMLEIGVDKFYIELIENYPCDNIEQLRKREGEYIRQLGTLNINIAGRTPKEGMTAYRETNKDELKQKKKQYYDEHREQILIQKKTYSKINSGTINEKHREKILCCCGCWTTYGHKLRHERSLKHQNYISKLKI